MVKQHPIHNKNNDTPEEIITQLTQMLHEQMAVNQEQIQANQKLVALNEALVSEMKLLRERMTYLTNKLYGRSKETLTEQASGQMSLDLFDEPSPLEVVAEEESVVKEHKRKKGTKAQKLANFPTKEIHYELSEEERVCGKCGSPMMDMGSRKIRDEIIFHQARIETLQHIQHSYCCKVCERLGETSLKKAEVPKPLLGGSLGSASVVAETIRLKFKQKVPAYRQVEHWQQLGLDISRENITNWHILVGNAYLSLLVERFRQVLLAEEVAFADETTYRVLESEKATNYYWVFSTCSTSQKSVVIYHHSQTRKREVPATFLSAFKGYLHCDGYAGYDDLPDVLPVRCWAHTRRKFYEAMPKETKEHPAAQVVQLFQIIFKKEQDWKELEPEERFEKRHTELRPLVDQLYAFIESIVAVPKSKLDKAIQYACKYRKDMERVFEDGRLVLTNNQSERYVKELVMGRKNYLFSSSVEGARTSGHILSVIQTAEQNGLNSSKYLQYLFEELPNLPVLTADALDDYLPWSDKVQAKPLA